MRISSFMIYDQITKSLQRNLSEMSILQTRLASGKKIDKPSDDVAASARAMDYRLSIKYNDQYKRNIDEAVSHLSSTESIMSSVSDALVRLKELAIQGADGSLNNGDRESIAMAVAGLRDHLLNLSNSKFRDRYIFSGFKTDLPSFDPAFNYVGDSGVMNVMIDKNIAIPINIPGSDAFIDNGSSLMQLAENLRIGLVNNDMTSIRAAMAGIDSAHKKVGIVIADIGSRLNRLDVQLNKIEDSSINLKSVLSMTEDADIAETINNISKAEIALQALRQSSARTLSQSLFDFLR